ncbi:nuclease-related domain-containing protein [Niallia sp. 03133]|uniref:nuclease-related domain-containing protein n=1 Tax=Niallia sp. 03133 TaxID=3458060 RepID=UPI004043E718
MIVKKLEAPISIPQMEALLGRIPPFHPKIPLIKKELQLKIAGYQGEKSLAFPFSFLPEKEYYILHDLRLFDGKNYFQIDALILSKKYALILEVKNIQGELYFDTEFKQLIRTKDGVQSALPYPFIQLKRLETQLSKWLSKYITIPLYSIIVISNPTSLIRTNSSDPSINKQIIHRDYIPFKVQKISNSIQQESITEQELKKVIKLLIKQNTPLDSSILKKFQIGEEEIISGVICTSCKYAPLIWIKANWHCPKCQTKNKRAFIYALKDYSYLIGKTINNQQVRDFLQIDSSALATRLMSKTHLENKGTRKDNEYYLCVKTLNNLLGGH